MKHQIAIQYDDATGAIGIAGLPDSMVAAVFMSGCLDALVKKRMGDALAEPPKIVVPQLSVVPGNGRR